MRLYQIVTMDIRSNGERGDEYQAYLGFDLKEALAHHEQALINYENASEYDKERSVVEARVYNIPDDTDTTDEDAVIDAMCDCIGYDDISIIKELRLQSGMSQNQFADFFNIPPSSLKKWEQGQRQCPDYLIELIEYRLRNENLIK